MIRRIFKPIHPGEGLSLAWALTQNLPGSYVASIQLTEVACQKIAKPQPEHACPKNPKGPRTQIMGFWGPKYYDNNAIWALKPYYLGPWTLRGRYASISCLAESSPLQKLGESDMNLDGVVTRRVCQRLHFRSLPTPLQSKYPHVAAPGTKYISLNGI